MDYREVLVWLLFFYCLDMVDFVFIVDLKSLDKESNYESFYGFDIDI